MLSTVVWTGFSLSAWHLIERSPSHRIILAWYMSNVWLLTSTSQLRRCWRDPWANLRTCCTIAALLTASYGPVQVKWSVCARERHANTRMWAMAGQPVADELGVWQTRGLILIPLYYSDWDYWGRILICSLGEEPEQISTELKRLWNNKVTTYEFSNTLS